MKVLVISRSPWDDSNSFGNTFSNLFGGMKGVEIFSICCQDGVNNNGIVSKTYQMTDRSVLNSLMGKHAGSVMASATVQDYVISKKKSNKFPKKRYTVFYIARDLIWNFGHWWDKDFKSFLDEIKPEVIYLPIYASWYMCDVQQKVVNYCKVPVVGHITDDNYNYPPNGWNQPLAYLYRANVRRKVRNLIAKCSYIEVFAENMAHEYAEIFKKPFYVIGKGIDISKVDQIKVETPKNNPVKYVDPNGLDIWEISPTGNITMIKDDKITKISFVNQKGEETKGYEFSKNDISYREDKDQEGNSIYLFEIKGDDKAEQIYNRSLVHTQNKQEFELVRIGDDTSERNIVGTSQSQAQSGVGTTLLNRNYTIREHYHNHPSGNNRPSNADKTFAKDVRKYNPKASFYINVFQRVNGRTRLTKNAY